MRKFKDITGKRFGRLTALYRLHNTKGRTKWLCVCECGNLVEVALRELIDNKTKSCGCLHKQIAREQHMTHGKRRTRLYSIYVSMKNRCYYKNNKSYKYYGGRGIAVCSEWKDNFQAFYDWAMANGYDDTLTIDRIDVNGNYEPNNCRWATQIQQQRNRTNNKHFTYNGETHCLSEWCEILGLKYHTVQARLKYGWTIERALQ